MEKLISIQKVNDAEIQLIQQQSALLLQKRKNGFNGELKSSGAIVENYIKGLLSKHLPGGYRICSGYIATPDSMQSNTNFIQHDIIIVDARIPPIHYFGISDIEVVCAESVCGIIEVKKTLTKKTLESATNHLRSTMTVLNSYKNGVKSKNNSDPIIGTTMSIGTYAPFYAVIALDCDVKKMNQEREKNIEINNSICEFIDFIWVPAASWLAFFMISKDGVITYPDNVSRNQNGYNNAYSCVYEPLSSKANIYSFAIACYRTWINNTSGKHLGFKENLGYFGFKLKD